MKKFEQNFLMFLLGGTLYGSIEVASRGYTHWSMIITGGSALLAIYIVDDVLKNVSVFIKAIAGAIIITALELTVGLIVNKIFLFGVWDYSNLRLNLFGQISLFFSLCWYGLSIIAFYLCGKIRKIISAEKLETV